MKKIQGFPKSKINNHKRKMNGRPPWPCGKGTESARFLVPCLFSLLSCAWRMRMQGPCILAMHKTERDTSERQADSRERAGIIDVQYAEYVIC